MAQTFVAEVSEDFTVAKGLLFLPGEALSFGGKGEKNATQVFFKTRPSSKLYPRRLSRLYFPQLLGGHPPPSDEPLGGWAS